MRYFIIFLLLTFNLYSQSLSGRHRLLQSVSGGDINNNSFTIETTLQGFFDMSFYENNKTGNAVIDWGDGTTETITVNDQLYLNHNYSSSASKTISIYNCNVNTTHINVRYSTINKIDISKLLNLKNLQLPECELDSIDLTKNTKLTFINLSTNNLSSLDLTNNVNLGTIYLGQNQITDIDLINNILLNSIVLNNNLLTSINLTANTALTYLDVYNNDLTALDISNNTQLTNVSCNGNAITELDVSNNTLITGLYCYSNQLTSLDVSSLTNIENLYCSNNQLTAISLPTPTSTNKYFTFRLDYNNLSTTAVNNALIQFDTSYGTATSYMKEIYLNNQTPSAPPSGDGATAKTSLINKNWTVSTD